MRCADATRAPVAKHTKPSSLPLTRALQSLVLLDTNRDRQPRIICCCARVALFEINYPLPPRRHVLQMCVDQQQFVSYDPRHYGPEAVPLPGYDVHEVVYNLPNPYGEGSRCRPLLLPHASV